MIENSRPVEEPQPRNWAFLGVKWYGYVFALMFLLYGGLKLVLGALDRDYTDTPKFIIFLLAGLVLLGLTMAFRDFKKWGWYGLVVLNGLVVITALFSITDFYNLPFLILSLAVLGALFSPVVRGEFF